MKRQRNIMVQQNFFNSLPHNLITDILVRVAAHSFKDFINVKLCCRGWNELGEDGYVLKHLSLHEFKEWKLLLPESEEYKRKSSWLVNKCADAGHGGAEYAAAMISILRGSEEGWESGTLRLKVMMQCKELRKKAIDAHRQMINTHVKARDYRLRTLPVNWSPQRRFCTDSHHDLQFLKVAAHSFKDFINVKLCCREWNELAEDGYMLKHLSLHEFKEWKLKVPESEEYKRKSSWLVNKCADAGNVEALYRKGLVGYLGGKEPEKGLQCLKNAANSGHAGAEYAAAMISILSGGEEGWESGTLRLKTMMQCKESRIKAIDAPRQLMYTHIKARDYRLGRLPVKLSDRRCCTASDHTFSYKKIFTAAYAEEGYLFGVGTKIDYLGVKETEKGLQCLKNAANAGHGGAEYVVAMISILGGGERDAMKKCKEMRKKAINARRQLKFKHDDWPRAWLAWTVPRNWSPWV
nr:putative F-box protein At1g67623 [Ipomoea batatas]